MKKQRNHTFPKFYTTAGAVGRAKRNFEQRFSEYTFIIQKLPDGQYMLICPNLKEQQEVVSENPPYAIV